MLGSLVVSFKELILLNWKVSEMEFISKREKKSVLHIVLSFCLNSFAQTRNGHTIFGSVEKSLEVDT